MLLNRTLYIAFVTMLALSPVLSIILSDLAGLAFNEFAFIWVGAGLSLPLSLLGARAFGEQSYRDYWAYLESFPGNTRTGILACWIGVTVLGVIAGIVLTT